jgi:diketogulonate reductase-like aldo/keto reductase
MRIVGLVGARALQRTGETRTPVVANGSANLLDVALTVGPASASAPPLERNCLPTGRRWAPMARQPGPLGFGTYRLTGDECTRRVLAALEAGYRHLDTARMYGNHDAVGDALARTDVPRDDVFVATKVWHDDLSHDDVVRTATAACEALGVDTIDLLYVHWPANTYDPPETLGALDELVERGVVDRVGLSNFTPDLLEEARSVLAAPLFAHQVELSPLLPQRDLHEDAVAHDHLLVAYSPIARGAVFDSDPIQRVARKHGATAAQVSLAWLLEKDNVVPIPGSADPAHIAENLAAADLDLDPADVEAIDAIDDRLRTVDPGFGPWNR